MSLLKKHFDCTIMFMMLEDEFVRNVLREEKKYLITLENYVSNCHFFKQVLHEDVHNGVNGYRVRSLYFDTIFDDDFYNKIDGLQVRRKI